MTIAMVTHGDGGSFWSVAKKGAEQAAKDHGRHAQVLRVQQRPREAGAADRGRGHRGRRRPRRLGPEPGRDQATRVKTAVDAGIPVITLNSGAEESASLGAITHVGQTETIAGEGAGAKLKEAGATKMHLRHPRAGQHRPQPALRGRQEGLRRRGRERPGRGHERHLDDADRDPVQARGRQVDRRACWRSTRTSRSPRVTRSRARARRPSSPRSTSPATSSRRSRTTRSLFAVDQQQYLQGYLPVVFLTLNKTNLNTVGGGQPVLTGPGLRRQDQRRGDREAGGGRHAMSTTLQPTSEPPPTAVDERLAKVSLPHEAAPAPRARRDARRRRRAALLRGHGGAVRDAQRHRALDRRRLDARASWPWPSRC